MTLLSYPKVWGIERYLYILYCVNNVRKTLTIMVTIMPGLGL